MTTYDLTRGGNAAIAGVSDPGVYVMRKQLDFSKSAKLANDILKLWPIPAGTLVDAVGYNVKTAEGATLTFDLGDDTSATAYASNVNGNSAARGAMALTLTEGTPNTITFNGKFYTAANNFTLAIDNNASHAVIEVFARFTDFASMGGAGGQNETPNIVTGGN